MQITNAFAFQERILWERKSYTEIFNEKPKESPEEGVFALHII